jgi:Domain of unknown function (DUF4266)
VFGIVLVPATVQTIAMRISIFFVLLSVAVVSGCVKVMPYQRGTLAHPTMGTDEVGIGIDGHVRGVSEGAAGGLGAAGGGCGCN